MPIMELSGEVDRSVGAGLPAQAAQLDALGVLAPLARVRNNILAPLARCETISGIPGRHDKLCIAQAEDVT